MLKNFATLRKRGFVKFLEKDQHLDPLNFYFTIKAISLLL